MLETFSIQYLAISNFKLESNRFKIKETTFGTKIQAIIADPFFSSKIDNVENINAVPIIAKTSRRRIFSISGSKPIPFLINNIKNKKHIIKYILNNPTKVEINLENKYCVFVYPLAIIFFVVPSLKSKQQNKAIKTVLTRPTSEAKKSTISGITLSGSLINTSSAIVFPLSVSSAIKSITGDNIAIIPTHT